MINFNPLTKFTTEQLKTELDRREQNGLPGKDWYFFVDFNENDDERFYIVHKRTWHLYHAIGNEFVECLGQLPDGFSSSNDSAECEYSGTIKEGKKSLLDLGFQELTNVFWWYDGLIVHVAKNNSFRVEIRCDNQDIYGKLYAEDGEELLCLSAYDYINFMKKWAEDRGMVFFLDRFFLDGQRSCWSTAILSKEVYESLPPAPQKEEQ